MKFDISDAEKINLHEAIEVCPHCGKSITPLLCTYHSSRNEYVLSSTYYAICQCPSKSCNAIFFAKYDVEDFPIPRNLDELLANIRNIEIFPLPSVSVSMDTVIKKISPLFIETYNQAVTAQANNLHLICGSGYRLAFEILVKDFACYIHPDKADDIKQDPRVSNVIANRIPDKPNLQELKGMANRAWWLGSDFSHYDKKYTDLDIKDLKACIEITVAEITYYLKKENYLNEITKP